LTTVAIDEETYSEQQVLELEISGFLADRLPRAQKEWELRQIVAATPQDAARLIQDAETKACPRCAVEVTKLTRFCKTLKCGYEWVKAEGSALDLSMEDGHVASMYQGSTQFGVQRERQQKEVVQVFVDSTQLPLDANLPLDGAIKVDSIDSSGETTADTSLSSPSGERVHLQNREIMQFEILPALMENPDGEKAMLLIIKSKSYAKLLVALRLTNIRCYGYYCNSCRIGEWARVRGFVPDDQVLREWVYFCADQGAIGSFLKHLDTFRYIHFLSNIRYVLSYGHESMAMQTMVLKLAKDHGYDALAPCYTFCSLAAQSALLENFDNHVCKEWLELCRMLICDELIMEWLASGPANPDSADELRTWTKVMVATTASDLHAASHAYLALDVLAAWSLTVKGMRRNDKTAYNAGRKTLLPFMGILGHHLYFRPRREQDVPRSRPLRHEAPLRRGELRREQGVYGFLGRDSGQADEDHQHHGQHYRLPRGLDHG
jgi:hypothetical protein